MRGECGRHKENQPGENRQQVAQQLDEIAQQGGAKRKLLAVRCFNRQAASEFT